ncbi:hypothetical protein COLO4_28153 [Corchorus olitorius]|uniref:Uncharacterized protein n=1 Tax=Corchorus olitorius TaxID=93759 RepID=A0A1R3HMK0_9ROSI|nr:hypothetical protein COLO4_28153 [Corchorus olitorius]
MASCQSLDELATLEPLNIADWPPQTIEPSLSKLYELASLEPLNMSVGLPRSNYPLVSEIRLA